MRRLGMVCVIVSLMLALASRGLHAGEVAGITVRDDGTVQVMEKKELCGNDTEGVEEGEKLFSSFANLSGGGLCGELPEARLTATGSDPLLEVLRETNRILSGIKDELAEIKRVLEKSSEEANPWNRLPTGLPESR